MYEDCLKYINDYWDKLTFSLPDDKGIHIELPNRSVFPNSDFFRNDQFYWDSYFIVLGLIQSKKLEFAKGIVDNLLHLFNKYGIIPSRNRFYNLGISQPPFLSSMVRDIYDIKKSKQWLKKTLPLIEKELAQYWMKAEGADRHLAFKGLSRYCDHYVTHITAEHESGWNRTSRFNDRCLDFLPVDLNSLLYKYEKDLSDLYGILGDSKKKKYFLAQANRRKRAINQLMWDGFFFDYDYSKKKANIFYSLAGYYPLWANLASMEQAKKMVLSLKQFEYSGGLANTQKTGLSKDYRQWDYPHGSPALQWMVIKGLLNYGFIPQAKRIANRWLDMNTLVYRTTREFWSRYDVVKKTEGNDNRYPVHKGYACTNAVFLLLAEFMQL